MVSKLRRYLESKYFLDRECNKNSTKNLNVRCVYGSECSRCCVIYKVTCKCCGEFYISNTQKNLKNRTEQHFQDVAQKAMNDNNLVSLAVPFAKYFTQNQVHNNVTKLCLSIYFLR